ncbi:hypothetical protein K402DRAFT_323651, partial [Aulographum hederae CBS 113979]
MACILLWCALALSLISLSSQQTKDPLNDFCRRFGHQTAVVDRKLYIDGGQVNWNPISANPLNYTNSYLLYNDLDQVQEAMPPLHANLTKNSTVPNVSGGTLWADEVNKVLHAYGGEFSGSPEDFTLWSYDTILDQWNQTDTPQSIQRAAWGAGVAVNERAEGYYMGGWLSNQTMPGWNGAPFATSTLIRYDMVGNTWQNMSGPADGIGRAEGVMVFLPASDAGLLIYFGGILDTSRNGTVQGSPMNVIHIFDLASSKWYTQTAGGDVPEDRKRFCAGATWAADHSSYNIYLYGGQGIPPNTTGFDDVYILSLPSFTWVKWWPTQPGEGNPHNSLSCNVIDGAQMLIIGGTFPISDQCDANTVWGTHNLNLGASNIQNAMWYDYMPNLTVYNVPKELIAVIGGGPSGGATQIRPQSWDNRDLPVYFSRVPTFPARTPTRAIPGPTSTSTGTPEESSNIAAIAGGAAGGGAALLIVLGVLIWCYC